MLEYLSRLRGTKRENLAADRRWVLRHPKWRLRLYTALAARYRMSRPMLETVRRMADRKAATAPKSREAMILRRWAGQMEHEGDTIDILLKEWVPTEELLIIAAAPDDKGLDRAAALLERTLSRRSMASAALFYPGLLLVMLFGMLWVVGHFVMPNVLSMQARQGVPPSFMLSFLAGHAWLAPLPFAVIVVAVRWSLPLACGPWRVWLDHHIWPWTQYRRVQGGAFLLGYAAMWGGGRTELETLTALGEARNPWLKERVDAIARWVEDGLSLGEAMASSGHGFPSPDTIDDISDIESTPDDMARHLEAMVDRDTKELQQQFLQMSTVMGVAVMLIVGIALLFIIYSIVSAFNLSAFMDIMQNQGQMVR